MTWLVGARGMLGTEVAARLAAAGIPFIPSGSEVDITDCGALARFAGRLGEVSHVINCAAYTAVDKAEDEPGKAAAVNTDGARNLARMARRLGAVLVHISTDYVFDGTGTRPYREDDPKSPLGVYGRTKSAGEDAVAGETERRYVLRTAWLYGRQGRSFVRTMLGLTGSRDEVRVVADQRGTPTNAGTLASVIAALVEAGNAGRPAPFGTYHVTDAGETTWHGFACEISRLGKKYGRIPAGHDCRIIPCASADYPTRARRPAYSVLDKAKAQDALRIALPQWQESLERFIKDMEEPQ